jgi:hypothetical protein
METKDSLRYAQECIVGPYPEQILYVYFALYRNAAVF